MSLPDLETTRPRVDPPQWAAGEHASNPSAVRVAGVAGARGGVGTSTFAAAVAARTARNTATVLVDLDHGGGGVDLLLGIEDVPGVRWPELAGARGDVPGTDLLAALPRWGRCAVLAAGRGAEPPERDVVDDVMRALRGVSGAVVADLGRSAAASVTPDAVVLVVPRDVRGVACAVTECQAWAVRGREVVLVARGPAPGGMGLGELAQSVGVRVTAAVPGLRGVAGDGERIGLVVRRPLARAADRVARELGWSP